MKMIATTNKNVNNYKPKDFLLSVFFIIFILINNIYNVFKRNMDHLNSYK